MSPARLLIDFDVVSALAVPGATYRYVGNETALNVATRHFHADSSLGTLASAESPSAWVGVVARHGPRAVGEPLEAEAAQLATQIDIWIDDADRIVRLMIQQDLTGMLVPQDADGSTEPDDGILSQLIPQEPRPRSIAFNVNVWLTDFGQ